MAFGDLPPTSPADIEARAGADRGGARRGRGRAPAAGRRRARVRAPPRQADAIEEDPPSSRTLGETLGEQFALGERQAARPASATTSSAARAARAARSTASSSPASPPGTWRARPREQTARARDRAGARRRRLGCDDGGGRAQQRARSPRSRSSPRSTSPPSTTSTWSRARWRLSSRCSAPRATSGSRTAPTACCPSCCRPPGAPSAARPQMEWVALPVSFAVALASWSRPASGRSTQAGLVRENYAGRSSPSRWARSWWRPRWWRSRRWRRWTTAPTSSCSTPSCGAGSPTWSASPSWGCSTTRSAAGASPARRGAGAATRAPSSPGDLSTGAIKAVGAFALAAYATSGLGRESLDYVVDLALLLLATNMANLLDLRPGRAEKALALVARRALHRLLDARAGRAARPLHRPGHRRRLVHPARAGDARRHRLQPDRRADRDLAGDDAVRPGAADRPRRC